MPECEHQEVCYIEVERVGYSRLAEKQPDGRWRVDRNTDADQIDSSGDVIDRYFFCYECGASWEAVQEDPDETIYATGDPERG